ncbi:MIP family channel protein [Marinifilum sp. N1E240]|uniref:MIP/aquaporin family protein n=1 Tax=Marinifilum sp. N1E240 TaxID=2608082 RepID=UPI00128E4AB2|nr:MIP/aquaporin family protein [Marinifilum sp. N1E240]MPQ47941.1 MIP family channel protein [Marinifilum sp. N1E240]
MSEFVAEFIGTMLLILLGNGVVANVVLNKTKGNNSGWIVITMGWGLAVFTGVAVAGPVSGAHINPAVTIGLALAGMFAWSKVGLFIAAQMLGAAMGAFLVWLMYRDHFNSTEDGGAKLACFSTGPAIRNIGSNAISEVIGAFVLMFVIFYLAGPSLEAAGMEGAKIGLGTLGALPVALLVVAIGLSLGGTTGYAINPARDLGPRIMHAILPMQNKGTSDWAYSLVPIVAPIVGTAIAAFLFMYL